MEIDYKELYLAYRDLYHKACDVIEAMQEHEQFFREEFAIILKSDFPSE